MLLPVLGIPPFYAYLEQSLYSGNIHIVPAISLIPAPIYLPPPTFIYIAIASLFGPVFVLFIGGNIPFFPSSFPVPLAFPSPPPPFPFRRQIENRITYRLFLFYYEFLPLPLPFL